MSLNSKGKMFSAFAILVILAGGFYALGVLTSPANVNPCQSGYQYLPTSSGLGAGDGSCAKLVVVLTQQQATYANPLMLAQGYTASCMINCNGVTYTLDPTVLITSGGHDFEQCKTFGSAGTITCTSGDSATIIGLSESTSTPFSGDYSASGPCKTTSPVNEISAGGLAAAAGSVAPSAQSSTVTTTITHTFTAAETDNAVQVACLQTELSSGTNPVIYAEGTFGSVSLVSGNTIQIQWSIART